MPDVLFAEADWPMDDWDPEDFTVEGIVMAVQACGRDRARLAVVTGDGQELQILGVRRLDDRVEIVVAEPAPPPSGAGALSERGDVSRDAHERDAHARDFTPTEQDSDDVS